MVARTGTEIGTTVVVLPVVALPSSEEEEEEEEEREGAAVKPLDRIDRGRSAVHRNEDMSASAGGSVGMERRWLRR